MSCFDEEPDGDPHGECAAEIARLNAEIEQCVAALPGVTYMDPPDGGDVSVSEQLRRMAADAARYRWLRDGNNDVEGVCPELSGPGMDDAIDAALGRREAELLRERLV